MLTYQLTDRKLLLVITGILILIRGASSGRTIYVAPGGNDLSSGTRASPLKTIQQAYHKASPGDRIRILPGTYRETVVLPPKTYAGPPITIEAENSATQRVYLSGAEPSNEFTWTLCRPDTCPGVPTAAMPHVYVTTLPEHIRPTVIVSHEGNAGRVLPIARKPNAAITDPSRHHEHWWLADPGTGAPKRLTDTHNDPNREIGTLRTIPDVSGGRLFLIDGEEYCGAFQYVRTITSHNRNQGYIETDGELGAVMFGFQHPGVGAFATYYIENAPGLLDMPGEWYFDSAAQKLYLYPTAPTDPSLLPIEIGARPDGIIIEGSRVTIRGITVRDINDFTYDDDLHGAITINPKDRDVSNIRLDDITIQQAGTGILAKAAPGRSVSHTFLSRITARNTAKSAISFIGNDKDSDAIDHITVSDSTLSHIGFPYNESAISLYRVQNVRLTNNDITDTASNGIHVTGFETVKTPTRNIRIVENTINHACMNSSGCAAIKLFGGVFRHAHVARNVLQDTSGWSYCHEQLTGEKGYGIGVFISNAEGITVHENTSARNTGHAYLAYTRQLPERNNVFRNNRAIASKTGIALQGANGSKDVNPAADGTRHEGTVISGNVLIANGIALSLDPADPRSITLSHNTFADNTYALEYQDLLVATPSAIRSLSPFSR